ncbi:hypothetical protein IAR55_004846 [Kwoniella newhampshirensis]|uniref:F-box domain-containing protein n=1 Tax=Kwoniella newhampshirensis TaxID=1651941 RepID=A0AAW0YW36_9TREE
MPPHDFGLSSRFARRRFQPCQSTQDEPTPSDIPNLPTDLYPLIISHIVNQSTLYRLTLVSRSFNSMATPKLYHSVELDTSVRSGRSFKQFIQNVPDSKKSLVRHLILKLNVKDGVRYDLVAPRAQRWAKGPSRDDGKSVLEGSRLSDLESLDLLTTGPRTWTSTINSVDFTFMLDHLVKDWLDVLCPSCGPKYLRVRHLTEMMEKRSMDLGDLWTKMMGRGGGRGSKSKTKYNREEKQDEQESKFNIDQLHPPVRTQLACPYGRMIFAQLSTWRDIISVDLPTFDPEKVANNRDIPRYYTYPQVPFRTLEHISISGLDLDRNMNSPTGTAMFVWIVHALLARDGRLVSSSDIGTATGTALEGRARGNDGEHKFLLEIRGQPNDAARTVVEALKPRGVGGDVEVTFVGESDDNAISWRKRVCDREAV